MKIGLIFPNLTLVNHNNQLIEFLTKSPYSKSLFDNWAGLTPALPTIAALTPSRHSIKIIDENRESIDFDKEYDLVGISCFTRQAPGAYKIADRFRSKGVKVVLGGIHPTLLPEEAKQHADAVVIGEAEYIWKDLLCDLEKNNLKPFYKSDILVDLKDSPIPRYDLLEGKNYKIIYIQTTRGCPHDCEFCAASSIYGNRYRRKSIVQVVEELVYIQKYFGNIKIGIGDDNLFVDKKYVRSLLKAITPLQFSWWGQADISIAEDHETLKLLKMSGCFALFIGLESVSENSLQNIDKHNWKAKMSKHYPSYVKTIQSYGIGIIAGFIIGLENDDEKIFQKIADFINDYCLYDATIGIYTPYPGTRLRERLEKEDRILPVPWDYYNSADVTFIHPTLSKVQLEDGQLHIVKSMYNKESYFKRFEYFKKIQKQLLG